MKRVLNRYYLAGGAVFILLALFVHFFFSIYSANLKVAPDGVFRITDFLYYLLMVKAFWSGQITSVYQVSSQRAVVAALAGKEFYRVMPVAITPTALLVWFPFVLVADMNLAWANTLWTSISLGVLFFAWWKVGVFVFRRKSRSLPFYVVLLLVFFFSVSMLAAISLGQNSLLATGLLTLFLYVVQQRKKINTAVFRLIIYVSIFTLSIKAPHLILALVILYIFGFWREVIVSAALLGFASLLLVVWVDSAIFSDYLTQLSLYNRVVMPDYYASAVVVSTTNTFRSAFSPLLGVSIVFRASQIVFAAGILMLVIVSFLKQKAPSFLPLAISKINNVQLVIALLSIALLFLTYVGRHEELLIFVAVAGVLLRQNTRLTIDFKMILWLLGLFLVLNHTLLPLDKNLWPFWFIKLAVLGTLYFKAAAKQPVVINVYG